MISTTIKFWFYLILLIPSILCSLFVLSHLLFDRTLRHGLHNHVIIILLFIGLICQLTIYPWMLYYYQYGDTWERSFIFCSIWGFLDWAFYVTQTIVFAWATIERHILIFHDKWVLTKHKRFLIHYLPLIFLLLYCLIFYIIIDFFPPCENLVFDFDMICIYFCLYSTYKLYMWQTIVHQILPNFIIVIFSLTLLIRALWHKHRMHQPIQGRKYRKMTIQVLSISLLYLLFSVPFILVTLLYLCGYLYYIYGAFLSYADFCSYLIILFFPFVCASSLPELRRRLKKFFSLQWNTPGIHPVARSIRANGNNRMNVR